MAVRSERRRRRFSGRKSARKAPHAVFRSTHPPRERSGAGSFEGPSNDIARYRENQGFSSVALPSFSRRSPLPDPPPQPESPRTMKSREHKLDICFDFTRGTCHRGDGCRFSHNLPPGGVIPPRPKTAGVCFDYTKGICNRGYVSRGSRRPRRDLRRDLADASKRLNRDATGGGSEEKRDERFLTIDI